MISKTILTMFVTATGLGFVLGAAAGVDRTLNGGSCEIAGHLPADGQPMKVGVAEAVPVARLKSAPEPVPVSSARAPDPPAGAVAPVTPPKPARPKPWWPSRQDGKLNILEVCGGEYSRSIVVRTDSRFDSANRAASVIQVTTADGRPVEGRWTVGADQKTLLMSVAAGRYTVKIGTEFADASGKTVSKASSGTVVVR